jgi:hypothetical protein
MIVWNNLSVMFHPQRSAVCISPSLCMGGLFSCERQTTCAQRHNIHRSYRLDSDRYQGREERAGPQGEKRSIPLATIHAPQVKTMRFSTPGQALLFPA